VRLGVPTISAHVRSRLGNHSFDAHQLGRVGEAGLYPTPPTPQPFLRAIHVKEPQMSLLELRSHPDLEEQLGSTRAEIARVEGKLERYFEGFERGRLAADLFQDRVRGHRDRLETLREREADLTARLATQAHTPPDDAALAALADQLEAIVADENPEQAKELLRLLVKDIQVHDRIGRGGGQGQRVARRPRRRLLRSARAPRRRVSARCRSCLQDAPAAARLPFASGDRGDWFARPEAVSPDPARRGDTHDHAPSRSAAASVHSARSCAADWRHAPRTCARLPHAGSPTAVP
jgi:hypothetical protein